MKLRSILAAAAAILAHCAASASVTGQVTIGQFTYTLTDLDPNDGSSSHPVSVDYTAQGVTVGGSLSGGASLDTASLSLYASTDPPYGQTVRANVHFSGEVTDSGEYNRLSTDGDLWLTGDDPNSCCVSQRLTADAGFFSSPTPAVPEPANIAMLAAGLPLLLLALRRRARRGT